MEAHRPPTPVLRIGVVVAGVSAVGEAFVRVVQERFQTPHVEVVVVAIGDSSGFVCPCASEPEAFNWDDIDAILTHKAGKHAIHLWESGRRSAIVLDGLTAALEHVHGRGGLADYVVVDCTSSAAITPALIAAKELGFAVILANKLPVAGLLEAYRRLVGEPSKPSQRVRYEATVGAGIPVVEVIQRIVESRDTIKKIEGGLSGTMTYILAAMSRGTKFSTALQEVKQLGITEADPRQDLSGSDVARKMVILAREIGIEVETSHVEISPLLPAGAFKLSIGQFLDSLHEYDTDFDARIRAAKDQGYALAYVGSIYPDSGKIVVGLEHVPPHSLFASASSTEGVVAIHSDWFPEPLMMRGTGAGATSTAAAVAGDLAAIIRQHTFSRKMRSSSTPLRDHHSLSLCAPITGALHARRSVHIQLSTPPAALCAHPERPPATSDINMTTHVEKALAEPAREPVPASPSKKQAFKEEMLSPVSKLELARKYAAEEQEKRVSAACERMVVVKKAQIVKKLEIEARLESHIEAHAHDDAPKRSGRLSDIAMRLVGAFQSTSNEHDTSAPDEKDDGDDTSSPTGKLLRATRNKLNAIAAEQGVEDLPATNYHLKQLGLADEKINIYAPLHEQQQEIRRRRESAIRCQEKYMQENFEYPADEGYKSEEDSDFAPEDDDDEDDDDSDSDDGGISEDELDEEEVRRLLEDQNEFAHSVATIKKHKKPVAKKAAMAKRALSPLAILGAILVLVLALVTSVFIAEQQFGYCRVLLAGELRADEVNISFCKAVVQLQEMVVQAASSLPFRS